MNTRKKEMFISVGKFVTIVKRLVDMFPGTNVVIRRTFSTVNSCGDCLLTIA